MTFLKRLRPSNLIILFALPFIVYLFVLSPNYSRSLIAIVGVERGAGRLVPGFLLLLAAFMSGAVAAFWSGAKPGRAAIAAGVSMAAGLAALLGSWAAPFVASVVANAVDPFTSPLVVQGETPRRLTDAAAGAVLAVSHKALLAYLALSAIGTALMLQKQAQALRVWAQRGLAALNALGFGYLILFAYLGFAAGVATSIRAAVLAYVFAVLLGLTWVGLLQMRSQRRTPWIFAVLVAALAIGAAWQFTRPEAEYALIGTLSGKVGILKGTPDSLIGAIQFGQFPGAASDDVAIRSFATPDQALAAIAQGGEVTAALVPQAAMPPGTVPLWQSSALPDGTMAAGAALTVLALVLALLAVGGIMHHRHPLSVGAEFIIDTIRGIPMLVIVLYIGLPLAGAVKDATGGAIDPPNLMRGIVAMALAYSAYLAEIFRSGINAVPVGQIEAARSLGLTRWQTARQVILPQAFRIIIPPLGNEFIAILKDTSLLSILSIRDITQRMREFQSASFLPFAPYNSAAIFYVLLTLVAASLVASVERKYHVKTR